jgi:competence protein ComEA
MWQKTWKDYFTFTKKERIAISILLVIIVVAAVLPFIFTPSFKEPFVRADLQAQLNAAQSSAESGLEANATNSFHPFKFNPNTVTASALEAMGVQEDEINALIIFRQKGGSLGNPEAFAKIPGINSKTANLLMPYISLDITQDTLVKASIVKQEKAVAKKNNKLIDINTATASDFETLPGIDEALANRIVKFRTTIHGFTALEDIVNTSGLDEDLFETIKPYLTISVYKEPE